MARLPISAARMLVGTELEMVSLTEGGNLAQMLSAARDYVHEDMSVQFVARDNRAEYHGLDGLVEGWRDWLEPWASYLLLVEDLAEAGDAVVALVHVRARTRRDDVEMEHTPAAVFTFEKERLRSASFFLEREEALEAAGISGS